MTQEASNLPVLVAGGGIGGLAAAQALTRRGLKVKVLEQAAELGESVIDSRDFPAKARQLIDLPKDIDAMEWLYGWKVESCLVD